MKQGELLEAVAGNGTGISSQASIHRDFSPASQEGSETIRKE